MRHPAHDASIIADTVLYAELRGNNQGVIKLVSGALAPTNGDSIRDIQVAHETPVSAKLLGSQRIGMCVVSKAVDLALEKAKITGLSIVGCSDYSSATGALGCWARKITDQGYIGIVMSQCNEMVAPHGSYEPIFGTNPIAIGIPTKPRAQILDMATSAIAYFGIKTAEKLGKTIPDDVAYDSNGKLTSNPTEALKGAIRVFDRGHKGSHLALMVELLAGALTGAAMEDKSNANNWGSLILVISPNIFGDEDEFLHRASEMCLRVKHAKLLDTEHEILLPGERGDALESSNVALGTVEVADDIFSMLQDLSRL